MWYYNQRKKLFVRWEYIGLLWAHSSFIIRPVSRGVQQVKLHPQDESRVHFAKPVFRRAQQDATGASAKLRLGLLKSLLKIDCGSKGLENARFFWGFCPLDTQWGVAPGPPLGDGALRLASLGQLHPQDENLATALFIIAAFCNCWYRKVKTYFYSTTYLQHLFSGLPKFVLKVTVYHIQHNRHSSTLRFF
jgi:hypothetical protein